MIYYPEIKKGDELVCHDTEIYKEWTGVDLKNKKIIVESANAFQVNCENELVILQPEYHLFSKA